MTSNRDGLGSYPQAITNGIVGERVAELIGKENDLTIPTLVLLLLIAQTSLLVSMVVGAWKYATTFQTARGSRR